jgi:arylsulfatase A-like enzyme
MFPGAGVSTNMTMISNKLKSVGYHCHFIGKWHAGMASLSRNVPQARGFETTLNYFDSGNNYYDSTTDQDCHYKKKEVTAVDLWNTDGPAKHLNGKCRNTFSGEDSVVCNIHTDRMLFGQ